MPLKLKTLACAEMALERLLADTKQAEHYAIQNRSHDVAAGNHAGANSHSERAALAHQAVAEITAALKDLEEFVAARLA